MRRRSSSIAHFIATVVLKVKRSPHIPQVRWASPRQGRSQRGSANRQ
ncbi:MAG: hypothetical protein KME50_13125 [Nostoc desertorum CM1-VF14]|nr:hypothetical protein [Nostoc desertorum CM1-VF14]